MAQDPIDSLINIEKLEKQKNDAIRISQELFDSLKKGFDSVNAVSFKLGTNTSTGGFNELKKQSEDAKKKMSDDAKEYTALWKKLLKEREDAEKAHQAAMDAARKKSISEAVNKVAADSNIALSRTLKDLQQGYDRLTKAERENEHIGGVLLARIQQLDKTVKATNESTGRFQLSVGNYAKSGEAAAKSTSNIQRQMAMFAGELPNIQYGFRTFASSLSNQFQGLFQAITQAKEANRLLREDGQKTIPVARQIVSGIFNWQTGLLALVAVGGLLVNWLTTTTKAEKEMSDATKENAESQKRLAETIGAEVSALNLLSIRAKDTSLSYKQRSDAVDELQKKFPEYFMSLTRESILNGNVAKAVDMATESIIRKARETQRVEKYTKAITELAAMENELQDITNPKKGTFIYDDENRAGSLKNQIEYQKQKVKELEKTLLTQNEVNANEAYWLDTNQRKRFKDNQEKEKANALLTEEQRRERDKQAKQKPEKDTFEKEKDAIAAQKAIAENEKMTFDQRYEAAVNYSKLSDALLKKQNKHSIDNITLYAIEADKLFTKINDDRQKAIDAQQKQIEAESKQMMGVILDQMNNVAQNENSIREKSLSDLAEDLSNRKITLQQYNTEKERINATADAAILKGQKDALNEYMTEQGLLPEEIARIQEVVTNIENQESKKRIAIAENEAKLKQEAEKKLFDLQVELGTKILDFTAAMFDRKYEKQLRDLEKTSEIENQKFDQQQKAIEESTYSEEEKAARVKVLDAQRLESEQRIKQQEDEINRKRDMAQRVKDSADIIAATLINEVQALSYLTNPITAPLYPAIAATIAALGAANLAVLNATPLPQYAIGKDANDPYTGDMIWGEAGTEAKVDRFGNITFATKRTKGFTEMGDTIISNSDLKKGALAEYLPSGLKEVEFDDLISATAAIQANSTNKIVKAIKSIPRSEGVSQNAIKAQLAAMK